MISGKFFNRNYSMVLKVGRLKSTILAARSSNRSVAGPPASHRLGLTFFELRRS
jgi:hypothetical protein